MDDKKINGLGESLSKLSKEVKQSGQKAFDKVGETAKDLYDNRKENAQKIKVGLNTMSKEAVEQSRIIGEKTKETAKNVNENIKSLDMFKTRLRKNTSEEYLSLVEKYENIAEKSNHRMIDLYESRISAIEIISNVGESINKISNTPKEFEVELGKVHHEVISFDDKIKEVEKADLEVKIASGSAAANTSLSGLGVVVATVGAKSAMAIATTFGTASTGAAISTLSGAAANSAALAWIGGGALSVGGGGMATGSVLLGLAGPVGWAVAGVSMTAAFAFGKHASNKNKRTTEELNEEIKNINEIVKKSELKVEEIELLIETTKNQSSGLSILREQLRVGDYNDFSDEEKYQAGLVVNSTLVLSKLINQELNFNE